MCRSVQHRRPREMNSVNDNIKKFEKYIDGLRTTTANFGHQRWLYDKNWQLRPLTHIPTDTLNKSSIN